MILLKGPIKEYCQWCYIMVKRTIQMDKNVEADSHG